MTLQRLALELNDRYHFSTCSPVISITHSINHGKIKASMGSSETVTGGMWRMALSSRNGGRNGWSYIYSYSSFDHTSSSTLFPFPSLEARWYCKWLFSESKHCAPVCTRQRCAHLLGKFFVTLPSSINCSLKLLYMKYVVNHLTKAIETIVC